MKRAKLLFILSILTFIIALCFACGSENVVRKTDPYVGFNGIDPDNVVEIDDVITLDGVLDEDIWAESKTAIEIEGAVKDQMTNASIDVEKYGERHATVYSYVGEKAIYWAFEVQDKNLYYNFYRSQGANTGIEIYFANSLQTTFSDGCYSVRVNPTGKGNETYIGMYQPKYLNGVVSNVEPSTTNGGNIWHEMTNMRGKVAAAATVDGTIINRSDMGSVDTSQNEGYVIEVAVDKALLGDLDAKDMIYTAAFVQARNFDMSRLNNTFIKGTGYLTPNTWKLVTNDGIVDDKYTYWDENTQADEGVVIDGKLEDDIWDGVQGRTIVHSTYKSSRIDSSSANVQYTTKAVTTEKGVYVALESNDQAIYYYPGYSNYFSTGVELMLTVGGDNHINEKTTRQIRFLVGGQGKRYYGKKVENGVFPYVENYFPAKIASHVINGQVGSADADGWQGEIFIPWSSFDLPKNADKSTVAILTCGYYAYEFKDGIPTARGYVAPVEKKVYGEGGDMNPQDSWFVFKNNQPAYDFSVQDVVLDGESLVGDYYETEVVASFGDNVATTITKEVFPIANGGTFDFDSSLGVIVTDNGDGTYGIKIPKDKAKNFDGNSDIKFSVGALSQNINVVIDEDFVIDGILDEGLWRYLNYIETNQTSGFSSSTKFSLALRENAMYVSARITDANFDKFRNDSALGLELYINTGDKISSETTRQLRLVSNSSAVAVYNYEDNGTDWKWSSPQQTGKVKLAFVSNNDGTYTLEARIPYDVIGLTSMPYSVQVAPFTKFVKNTSGGVSTKFINWEGNQFTYDPALYSTFDCEVGYAPDKMVIRNSESKAVDAVELIRGLGINENSEYEGRILLSLFPEGGQPIQDANFGEFNKYFAHVSNGEYYFAIPSSVFENEITTLSIKSIDTTLRTTLDVEWKVLEKMYFSAENANLYAVDCVSDEYHFNLRVTADESGLIPVNGITFGSGWNVVDNGDGTYKISVSASTLQSADVHSVSASITLLGETITDEVTFRYSTWTDEELGKVRTFLDFNGNITDKSGNNTTVTAGTGSTITYVEDGAGLQGVQLQNPDTGSTVKRNVNVAQFLGNEDFTMSFDFRLDSSAIGVFATGAQYEIVSSGTSVDTSADCFQISAYDNGKKSTGFRIQLGCYNGDARYATYNYYELGIVTERWYNLTLVVDRNYAGSDLTNEKVAVSLYINGEFRKQNIVILQAGQVLGHGNIALGGDYWEYDGGQRYLEMDNFVLYDGLFTDKQISDVAVRANNLY